LKTATSVVYSCGMVDIEYIERERKRRFMTATRLAHEAGISATTYTKLVKNKGKNISLGSIEKISGVLQLEVEKLFPDRSK